jgi:hypothetical protein
VLNHQNFTDVNAGEGSVMRQFESMLAELDIAGWTAKEIEALLVPNLFKLTKWVVRLKGQIGHFIVSIAKTLDQKKMEPLQWRY